jgi:hypothetical protein
VEKLWATYNTNRSKRLAEYADEKKTIHDKEEIAIVIGGGNIFRGVAELVQEWIACKALYGNVSNRYQRNGITRFIRRKGNENAFANGLENGIYRRTIH